MKTFYSFTALAGFVFSFCSSPVAGQTQGNGNQPAKGANDFSIVSRTPYSRVWQQQSLATNQLGVVQTNIQSFTEVRSGLCRNDSATGALVDASSEIDLVANGAQAVFGVHQAFWAANANTPGGGAVRLVMAGGDVMSSTLLGVAYWDSSTDTNLLIGSIQDSQGVLNGNQVTYENAFGGNIITADIEYAYNIEGFEQCVVFREQLPDPSAYGMDADHTYVQVLTEFFNPPKPVMQSVAVDGVADDEFINFGDMSIGVGQAFLATNQGGVLTAGPVEKQWITLEGRNLLVEQIPFSQISALQEVLPQHASISKPSKKITRMAALKQKPLLTKPKDFGSVKLATTHSEKPGLVIDYNLVNNATNVTFRGDTTYYVSGTINIYGTNTFEGGAVIKFTNNASITEAASPLTPQLNFVTGPYRPVIFTGKDDNSIGQTITGSTGNPYTNFYAKPALAYGSISGSITNIRISYASQAISVAASSTVSLTDVQIVGCSNGITVTGSGSSTLRNALFANDYAAFNAIGSSATVKAESSTVGSNTYLVTYTATNGVTMNFTNCIFSGVAHLTNNTYPLSGNNNGFYATQQFGSGAISSSSYPFQIVGAGSYYLASGSPFLNAATVNVDAGILADLAQKTVYPPLTINAIVTNNLTMFPQAQRDSNTPSLGWHYDPIDWAGSMALSNAILTALPGTAVAAAGAQYGVWTYDNSMVNFQGTATAPIHFVRYNTVQEQSNTNWESSNWQETFVTQETFSSSSVAAFQFTVWSVLAGDAHMNTFASAFMAGLNFENCQFYNGQFNPADPAIGVTNCLFRRVATSLSDTYGGTASFYFYNNLFTGGSVGNVQFDGGVWTFKDNLFDTTNIGPPLAGDVCSNNAYLSTNTLTGPSNVTDVVLLASPAYQVGTLGQYYYPTSLTSLLHKGSRLASDAGLYHYTITTNNVIESNSVVSIGFHFVATDPSGNPLDANGDGIPDYIEDANGDGFVSSGEIGWNLTNDLGLTVIITQPVNNSKIP